MPNMINDNEDPIEMEYELEATTAFEVGTTSDLNLSKRKKKTKTPKARVWHSQDLRISYWSKLGWPR